MSVLSRLARIWEAASGGMRTQPAPATFDLPPAPATATASAQPANGSNPGLAPFLQDAGDWWLSAFRDYLADPAQFRPTANYSTVLLTALGIAPGSLLRADLAAMTRGEWNALALRGIPIPAQGRLPPWDDHAVVRHWMLAMALHQLGFSGSFLRFGRGADRATPEETAMIEAIEKSGSGQPGLLVFEAKPGFIDPALPFGRYPLLTIPFEEVPRMSEALGAMHGFAMFAGVVVEVVPDLPIPLGTALFGGFPPMFLQRPPEKASFTPTEIDEHMEQNRLSRPPEPK